MDTATTNPKPRNHRQRDIAGQAKAGIVPPRKKTGRPLLYSEKTAALVCERLSNGETLSVIVKDLGIHQDSVYAWLQKYPIFSERYSRAKENQAVSLLNELLDETKELQNDRALAMRVRSDLIKWYAAKTAPQQFGDSKIRLELSGEVTHTHVHQLAPEQRRRIAEAWLMSQTEDDTPGITAETTGPALPAMAALEQAAVGSADAEDERLIPTRRKTVAVRESGRRRREDPADW